MSKEKRYAIVGSGSRSYLYLTSLASDFKEYGNLVAICDTNNTRMQYAKEVLNETYSYTDVQTYFAEDFLQMLTKESIDTLIVVSIDRTHCKYITEALYAGCDVITEKPIVINAKQAKEIIQAVEETGKTVKVAFNYRYTPRNTKIKELLAKNIIGKVNSIHFEWLLDTSHGADYFRRWHRNKRNSGGLAVHKATHHFDLVNWWIDSSPELVFAAGDLMFYGRENNEQRGNYQNYDRATDNPNAKNDPFALDLHTSDLMQRMYLDAEHEDGYRRDENVFGDYISIEDDLALAVKYESGVLMSYHLTAYSPWEGFRIMFNGSEGRLEYEVRENTYVSAGEKDVNNPLANQEAHKQQEQVSIILHKHWQKAESIPITDSTAKGHGGGDERLMHDLFVGNEDDPYGRKADHLAGIRAALTGICANISMKTGQSVVCKDVIEL